MPSVGTNISHDSARGHDSGESVYIDVWRTQVPVLDRRSLLGGIDNPKQHVDKAAYPQRLFAREAVRKMVMCTIPESWDNPAQNLRESALVVSLFTGDN